MKKRAKRKTSYLIQPDTEVDNKYSGQGEKNIVAELQKCSNGLDGLKYFINEYIYVPNRILPSILTNKPHWFKHLIIEGNKVNLKLYNKQSEYLDVLYENRLVASVKGRQVGISTITQAYILQYALFNDNKEVVIVSKTETEAIKFLDNVYFMYNHLPFFLRRNYSKAVKKSFQLGTVNNSTKISCLTSTAKSGRSFSATVLIIDECINKDQIVTIMDEEENTNQVTMEELNDLCCLSNHKLKILSFDGTNHIFQNIIEVKELGEKETIKYSSIEEISLTATQNHPVLNIDENYKNIGDVEFLPLYINNEYFNDYDNKNKDFNNGKIFGFIYGDGWMGEGNHLGVSGKKEDLSRFGKILDGDNFLNCNHNEFIDKIVSRCSRPEWGDNTSTMVHLPAKLYHHLETLDMPKGKKITNTFTLPNQILDSTDAIQGFWNGIFSAEGSIRLWQSQNNNSIGEIEIISYYKDISYYDEGVKFLESLLISLNKIGIKNTYIETITKQNTINKKFVNIFRIKLCNKHDIELFLQGVGKLDLNIEKEFKRLSTLSCYAIKDLILNNIKHYKKLKEFVLFGMNIKISQNNKISLNVKSYWNMVSKYITNNILFIPIIDKSENQIEKVYNINVENTHTFTANNIITHNCEFVDHVDSLWAAAQPTLSATGGQGILISTPWMYKSWFQGICHGDDEGAFQIFKIHQKDIPGRDNDQYEDQCKELNHDKLKIMTELDMQQIVPYIKYFNEEYMKDTYLINEDQFERYEREYNLGIIHPWKEGIEYFFGADTYEGGADYNAGTIIGSDMRVYAYYKTKRTDIKHLVRDLCDAYKTKVNVERNRGFQLVKEFEDDNLAKKYLLCKLKKQKNVIEVVYGYNVGDNRKTLLSYISDQLKYVHTQNQDPEHVDDLITIPEELMSELRHFVVKKSKVEGLEHDDLIFSLVAALYVKHNKSQFANYKMLSMEEGRKQTLKNVESFYGMVNDPKRKAKSMVNRGKLNAVVATNFLSDVVGKKSLTVEELGMLEKLTKNNPFEEKTNESTEMDESMSE